jgi:small subunit ribosomal protein S13
MIRIAGVIINPNKQARFALSPIKGIGKSNVKKLLKELNIGFEIKLGELTEEKIVELRNHIEKNYLVEADLRRKVQADIKRLVDIKCYRGLRHTLSLPVRGQRTKTNSRTRRGKKSLAIAGKKKATK